MTRKEKALEIARILDDLYPTTPIPLEHKDPYTLLIAVLLSAQCTDARVNTITPLLFARADNPFDMVKLTVDEIRAIISLVVCLQLKVRQYMDFLKFLINKFEGKVPNTFKDLESLPGVGHKTASVVMSQAFASLHSL